VRRHGEARPERPKLEARRVEVESGVLEKGSIYAPLPTSYGVWERCKFSGVQGEASTETEIDFVCF